MQPQQNNLLETDLLKTFVTISETGNFTVAAKRVFRTPSAVSMQIRRLEDQLGRALFVRHPRHVTLTADGEAFLVHARDILRINDEALSRFRVPQLEGRVRFGAPDDFGVRSLPAILSRFAATHPLVEVEVFLSTSAILARRFEAAEIDMILTVSAQSDPAPGEVIHSEPLVWVGARDGMAFSRTPVPLALSSHGCPWRAAALASNIEKHGVDFKIACRIFEAAAGQVAAVMEDTRRDYGERRMNSIGEVAGVLVLVVTHTDRNGVIRLGGAGFCGSCACELWPARMTATGKSPTPAAADTG
ncbi:LysR family transcriptional regulator [Paracoccus mutanolyticus]|uniref:LysR family transcriptional regulator n=1 Tax=Paracoccus mutanolyticus TaxID=1499308 RepID=A0ABN5MCG6_9RHOB|nr:LysR family transcriptional regulator [Paracoccus mutanolyticus]AWX93533.1 LysR family transcriptional regulator [Paracoccus mutanolyticus]